jgi:hypothetical protein
MPIPDTTIRDDRNPHAATPHAARSTRPVPRLEKPESGHADTISITVRACRTSWNAMKPRIHCALTGEA